MLVPTAEGLLIVQEVVGFKSIGDPDRCTTRLHMQAYRVVCDVRMACSSVTGARPLRRLNPHLACKSTQKGLAKRAV